MNYYRAYFKTGFVELSGTDLREATKRAREVGAEEFPNERLMSVVTCERPKRRRPKKAST